MLTLNPICLKLVSPLKVVKVIHHSMATYSSHGNLEIIVTIHVSKQFYFCKTPQCIVILHSVTIRFGQALEKLDISMTELGPYAL